MSPLPTPLSRQDADPCPSHVWTGTANAGWTCTLANRESWEARSETMTFATTCGTQGERLR
jgi:hypothetical protein